MAIVMIIKKAMKRKEDWVWGYMLMLGIRMSRTRLM
jgi:hypothetical protein